MQRGIEARGAGRPGAPGPRRRAAAVLCLLAGALGGCGGQAPLDAPVQWWHELEGGTIARQRPPPPGIGQPYPLIGTVPARPALPDLAARTGETDRLAAQREQTERVLTRTPLPPPGSATAQALASEDVAPGGAVVLPGAPAGGVAATAGARGSGRTADAARAAPGGAVVGEAAPAPIAGVPAAGAPVAGAADPNLSSATLAVAAAPAPPPPSRVRASATAAPAQRATPQELAVLQNSAPAADAPLLVAGRTADAGVVLPPVAAEPPPPPSFEMAAPGAAVPGGAGGIAGAPPADRSALSRATPEEPLSRRGTPVRFQPGTAALLPDQAGVLRALAGRRGGAPVAVTGYGDAGADTPDAQSEALSLGLRRAQAMSAVLGTYGVPAESIRIAAEAFGRGGTVRLIH